MKTQLVEFKCDYCGEKVMVNMEKPLTANPMKGWIQIVREPNGSDQPKLEHYCKINCAINGLGSEKMQVA